MSWIAETGLATIALWVAVLLTGLLAGMQLSRWKAPTPAPHGEGLLLAASAAGLVAWCAQVGSLLANAASNPLLTAHVPIPAPAGFRLAVLWSTLPGGALTFGVVMLLWAATAARPREGRHTRFVAVVACLALVSYVGALWFAPAPNAVSSSIPPFVQDAGAAVAPLLAGLALALLALAFSARIAGAPPSAMVLTAAWTLATLAVGAEQAARSRLGIGPREAIVFGTASSGLVLWLVTSALLHRGVQSPLLLTRQAASPRSSALVAHTGAALVLISFAAHAFAKRANLAIAPGTVAEVQGAVGGTWRLANQGVSRFDDAASDVVSVAVEVTSPTNRVSLLTPERREYHSVSGGHLANAVASRASTGGMAQSMRILLTEADSLDVAHVRVTFLPVPILWPVGMILLLLSPVASMVARRSGSAG